MPKITRGKKNIVGFEPIFNTYTYLPNIIVLSENLLSIYGRPGEVVDEMTKSGSIEPTTAYERIVFEQYAVWYKLLVSIISTDKQTS